MGAPRGRGASPLHPGFVETASPKTKLQPPTPSPIRYNNRRRARFPVLPSPTRFPLQDVPDQLSSPPRPTIVGRARFRLHLAFVDFVDEDLSRIVSPVVLEPSAPVVGDRIHKPIPVLRKRCGGNGVLHGIKTLQPLSVVLEEWRCWMLFCTLSIGGRRQSTDSCRGTSHRDPASSQKTTGH